MTNTVSFDPDNRELRSVRFHFFDNPDSVNQIHWLPWVVKGTPVQSGDHLATIEWTHDPAEDIVAPIGCDGTIEWVNRAIAYLDLDDSGQLLLSLKR